MIGLESVSTSALDHAIRGLLPPLPSPSTRVDEQQSGAKLKVFAFGAARVEFGGRTLTAADWTYAKSHELLLYLLCHPPRTKEQIGLALWPDASAASCHRNLRRTLHYLRHALDNATWIVLEGKHYTFNRTLPFWFDVEAFDTALAAGQRLLATDLQHPPPPTRQFLETAATLYRGDFLEELVTAEWPLLLRDDLRRRYQALLFVLGHLRVADGEYAQAAAVYRQLIGLDDYLEEAHRQLMRCYARLGERSQALRHYLQLRQRIRVELDAMPDPETTALFEHLRRGEAT